MGDRRWVVLEFSGADLGIYTHWGGTYAPGTVQAALARRERWGDDSYLARIIFSEFIKDEVSGETGYGLVPVPKGETFGEEHPDIRVDMVKQTVSCKDQTFTFDEFVALTLDELLTDWE